jgi:hypothetical protein
MVEGKVDTGVAVTATDKPVDGSTPPPNIGQALQGLLTSVQAQFVTPKDMKAYNGQTGLYPQPLEGVPVKGPAIAPQPQDVVLGYEVCQTE